MGVVLDEAEAAGGLVEAVEAHDDALDFAALGEELVDLLFCGVEGAAKEVTLGHASRKRASMEEGLDIQVADVEGCRVGEGVDGGLGCVISVVVSVASALILQTHQCLFSDCDSRRVPA